MGALMRVEKFSHAQLAENCENELERIKLECDKLRLKVSKGIDRQESVGQAAMSLLTSGTRSPSFRRPSLNNLLRSSPKSPATRLTRAVSGLKDQRLQMAQSAKDVFKEYDTDSSGEIDQSELQKLLTDMGFDGVDDFEYEFRDTYDLAAFLELYVRLTVQQSAQLDSDTASESRPPEAGGGNII
jgi:hypothetical protein